MARYREMIDEAERRRDTDDAPTANRLALEMALVAIDARIEAAGLELHRKDLLHGIRDRVMQERQMAKTPAEEIARADAQYVEYCERIASLDATADRAKAYSCYFGTLAGILPAAQAVGA